jgi:hypothetical protein
MTYAAASTGSVHSEPSTASGRGLDWKTPGRCPAIVISTLERSG